MIKYKKKIYKYSNQNNKQNKIYLNQKNYKMIKYYQINKLNITK